MERLEDGWHKRNEMLKWLVGEKRASNGMRYDAFRLALVDRRPMAEIEATSRVEPRGEDKWVGKEAGRQLDRSTR